MKKIIIKRNDKYRGYASIFGVLFPITKEYTYKEEIR